MARYNKYNRGIKYNQKSDDEGGIYNYRVFGNAGAVISKLVVTASFHLKRSASSVVGVVASLSGVATITFHVAAEIILNFILRLRDKYKPVYPELSVMEYLVSADITEYRILLEVGGMPFVGSTVTLKGTFPNSAGDLEQLGDVVCNVYFPDRTLAEAIEAAEISTGVYSADYTIPEGKEGKFDYEFIGTLGSKTIVGRSSFDSLWKY